MRCGMNRISTVEDREARRLETKPSHNTNHIPPHQDILTMNIYSNTTYQASSPSNPSYNLGPFGLACLCLCLCLILPLFRGVM